MAFINISDPHKRKEIVEEYMKTKNELRLKNENKKEGNLIKEQQIEEQYRPLISATEESTKKITSALQKNTDNPLYSYSKLTRNKDRYYSIYQIDTGEFKLGDSNIDIDDKNNIIVDGKLFNYTHGFWNLLMLNNPDNYTKEDLANYVELIKLVNLVDNPRIEIKTNPRATTKYKFLQDILGIPKKRIKRGLKRLRPILDEESEGEQENKEKTGEGIILPGDINGLLERLQLVCAERAAGNIKATTSEIVAILDELLRKNYISKREYNVVCKKLEC